MLGRVTLYGGSEVGSRGAYKVITLNCVALHPRSANERFEFFGPPPAPP
jgi:hypothetical protein